MKKLNFAICDLESAYAGKLTDYISDKQNIPFQILAFSGIESLESFVMEHEIELLLISSKMMCSKVRQMNIKRIIILSEGEVIQEYQDYPTVYKYQASDNLVAEVMDAYVSQAKEMAPMFMPRNAKVIGVYSPIGRCGKTTFALTLGQILAQKQSVLYLNLEDCSGFAGIMDKVYKADITDIMYYIRQKMGNVIFKMNSITQKLGNMDYVPPAYLASDLNDVMQEEWMILLGTITSLGGYECVILDMGGTLEARLPLLSSCTEIFTPTCEGISAHSKIQQYEKQLEELEYSEILDKTRYIQLPFVEIKESGEYTFEQLIWGEMGEFIRETII